VTVLARGREADIVAAGDGRVLRRYHGDPGGRPAREAAIMRHVRARGYPVPEVHEQRPDALVLERIDGPTMADDALRRPWRLRRHARTLADLHRRLHAIEPPAGLPSAGDGRALLHLDLHPENVLLAGDGPRVIDWTNARAGPPALDVALTWVILATVRLDSAAARAARDLFVRAFLASFDRAAVRQALPAAVERRLADPNLSTPERDDVRRFLATAHGG
jgi:aminoglycoside phosphotransferase (APT) family kinase protein